MKTLKIIIFTIFFLTTLSINAQEVKPYRVGNFFGLKKGNQIILRPKYGWIGSFYNGLAQVIIDSKYGFINEEGDIVIPLIYDYTNDYQNQKGLIKVSVNKKCGFINHKGKVIIPIIYETIGNYATDGNFHYGISKVKLDGKYGFIDTLGNVIIHIIYNEAYITGDSLLGYIQVRINKKWGILDSKGNEIIPIIYRYADRFLNGVAKVELHDPTGYTYGFTYFNKKGEKITNMVFNYADRFRNNCAAVSLKEKFGLIDTSGKMIVPLKYKTQPYIFHYESGIAVIVSDKNLRLYNINEKKFLKGKYHDIRELYGGLARVCTYVGNKCKWGYVNKEGKVIIPLIYDKAEDYNYVEETIKVKLNGKDIFLDKNGKEISK